MKDSFLFYFEINVMAFKGKCFISCKLVLPHLVILVCFFNVFSQFDDCLDVPHVIASIFYFVVYKLKNLNRLAIKSLV